MKNSIKSTLRLMVLTVLSVIIVACGGEAGNSKVLPVKMVLPVVIEDSYVLEELRILVIGQSISSNCNEFIYGAVDNVYQIGRDGTVKAAKDPFEWADCEKGSIWSPLGRELIAKKIAKKVIFMPIGVGSTKVQDWQPGGKAFDKLNAAILTTQQNKIEFDAAFWLQGSSDIGTLKDEYVDRLSSLIDFIKTKIKIKRWFVAVHSKCYGNYSADVEAAQRIVASNSIKQQYLGANLNALGNEYRFDECHLNQQGQEKAATMWLEAVRSGISGS